MKKISRLAFPFYCRKLRINKPEILSTEGPLLLACNHPNSFLDSIVLDTLFRAPIYSLARGDVFKKPFLKILKALKILPVYRRSEGVENLSENYKTFNDCIEILKNNGVVAIFSEGKCINEWHLRPLKKGTARLAIKAWEENIPLTIIPVALNYSSFKKIGKNITLSFGNPIHKEDIPLHRTDGMRHLHFNQLLQTELEKMVFEIPNDNKPLQKKLLQVPVPAYKKILLFLPAIIGYLLHWPLYVPLRKYIANRTYQTDHFDSVMTGALLLVYPVYLLLITIISALFIRKIWVLSGLLLIPFTAWSYLQLKKQMD
ncbi:MAG: 1-acyl-sn-glycerol-3-phosphate acyltransferase [Chitinophagaceae bacterium]|nr:1-acyl-sn-glycerol-3-phosphate acyltransferase [Chitinophagaceae bacterium]